MAHGLPLLTDRELNGVNKWLLTTIHPSSLNHSTCLLPRCQLKNVGHLALDLKAQETRSCLCLSGNDGVHLHEAVPVPTTPAPKPFESWVFQSADLLAKQFKTYEDSKRSKCTPPQSACLKPRCSIIRISQQQAHEILQKQGPWSKAKKASLRPTGGGENMCLYAFWLINNVGYWKRFHVVSFFQTYHFCRKPGPMYLYIYIY